MRIICITGANGLLGNKLIAAAQPPHRIVAIDLHATLLSHVCEAINYRQGDITDEHQIVELIAESGADSVIHTAAFTDVDGCEKNPDKAWQVNVDGTRNVVAACKKTGARLIHLSTDFVFNGDNGPYDEEATPAPINIYGKTKLESEKIIQSDLQNWIIARTMILFGYASSASPNFVTWLVETLSSNQEVHIVNDQFGTPTLADDLARGFHQGGQQPGLHRGELDGAGFTTVQV